MATEIGSERSISGSTSRIDARRFGAAAAERAIEAAIAESKIAFMSIVKLKMFYNKMVAGEFLRLWCKVK